MTHPSDPVTGGEVEAMIRDLLEPEPVAASEQIMRNAATMLASLSAEVERLRGMCKDAS